MSLLFVFSLAFAIGFCSETLEKPQFLPLTGDVLGKDLEETQGTLPRNFRTAQDPIEHISDMPRLDGLADLSIAGSAQFTEPQLVEILNYLGRKTLVIDLREETHLIFEDTDGVQIPITAYLSQNLGNFGKNVEEIKSDIGLYKTYILGQSTIPLHYTENSEVKIDEDAPVFEVKNVYAEWEIVEKASHFYTPGVEYVLFPITDHKNPSPQSVDAFLSLFEEVKDDRELVLLFHCQAGRGRTGLFMVMTDMIQNAKKYQLSFRDILKRQELLGSPDFSKIKPGRAENSAERYAFLQRFYQYVIDEKGLDAGASYSLWSQRNSCREVYEMVDCKNKQ